MSAEATGTLRALERPAAGEPTGALVLLHGRGADERDLYPLLDAIDPERRLHGYTPRGPLALPPGGAHWYALPPRLGHPPADQFRASLALLGDWLDGLPFPSDRIALGGFSQGAVMSYALGLGEGRPRPAALIALSGFVPTVEGWELDLEPPFPPVLIAHGTYDPIIPVELGRQARDRLAQAGAEPIYRESPLDHTIDPRLLPELQTLVAGALR